VTESPVRRLVGLPVRAGARRLGAVDDLILGADLSVVLGLVVETDIGQRRFLPWASAVVGPDGIEIARASALLGETELSHYLQGGVGHARLTGLVVSVPDGASTVLGDVLVGRSGAVAALILLVGDEKRVAPLDTTHIRWSAGRLLEVSVDPLPVVDVSALAMPVA
jgi:hypothetical protein